MHWYKDLKHSTKVKDEEGFPSFALVNKVTGEAIKHSIGATNPVRLVPYNSEYLDESILWSESNDTGGGYRCIRMVNNIRLNFDAFHGDKDHGGVRDGTSIVLWEWLKGDNQRWKIEPQGKFFQFFSLSELEMEPVCDVFTAHLLADVSRDKQFKTCSEQCFSMHLFPRANFEKYQHVIVALMVHIVALCIVTLSNGAGVDLPTNYSGRPAQQYVRIFTKAGPDYSLSIRDGRRWFKDTKYSNTVKDEEGFPGFALVNKMTGEAIKHSIGAQNLLALYFLLLVAVQLTSGIEAYEKFLDNAHYSLLVDHDNLVFCLWLIHGEKLILRSVRLIPYNPNYLDESVLWAESNDTGEGFRCIRMVNNIRLNFDAFHGDKEHGGVRDGTAVGLWEWLKGDNQQWKIVPF
ncbi:hypothetical protein ZIOFF_054722 [Zingiber officinale]|uniref:Uncharacterized protein n=1 Tax=Zingiber officinale TaxID=94328 RepID=A0A8J5KDX9_ZINOF|nr:hypothetical protein ZIOFF_054722 [Zingiber officinale]